MRLVGIDHKDIQRHVGLRRVVKEWPGGSENAGNAWDVDFETGFVFSCFFSSFFKLQLKVCLIFLGLDGKLPTLGLTMLWVFRLSPNIWDIVKSP